MRTAATVKSLALTVCYGSLAVGYISTLKNGREEIMLLAVYGFVKIVVLEIKRNVSYLECRSLHFIRVMNF